MCSCPRCGNGSATASVTEKYDWTVDFSGVPFGTSNSKVISGGRKFLCDTCGENVSALIRKNTDKILKIGGSHESL